MSSQIRRFLYTRILIAVVASGLLAGLGSLLAGLILARDYVSRATAAGMADAARRMENFDLVMDKVLRESRERGEAALLRLAEDFPDRERAAAAGMDRLSGIAASLDVDEVYFIGRDGLVFATSFYPDLGLKLFSLSPSFEKFLRSAFSSGAMADQGLSRSTQTFVLNHYLYYAPPGRDFMIEVSVRMPEVVRAAYPNMDYETLAETFLGIGEEEAGQSPVRILDYVDDAGISLFREGLRDAYLGARIAAADSAAAPLFWREGRERRILLPLALKSFGGYRVYALLAADESLYPRFMWIASFVTFLVVGAGAGLSFVSARSALGPAIASRLESLAEAMGRVARGEAAAIPHEGRDDEIGAIEGSAASMVETILKDTAELRELARKLEEEVDERRRKEAELEKSLEANKGLFREVNHRVKNNLQLMASLARLEGGARSSPEAEASLERMEARLLVMSALEDSLLRSPSLEGVDLLSILEEAAARAAQARGAAGSRLFQRISSEAGLVEADDAMAMALSAYELADNAYRHAFPEPAKGTLSMRAFRSESGSVGLEVLDDGIGLSPQAGEGLGLTIVRAAVAQRSGSLILEPNPQGKGTRAAILLPPLRKA